MPLADCAMPLVRGMMQFASGMMPLADFVWPLASFVLPSVKADRKNAVAVVRIGIGGRRSSGGMTRIS